MVLDKKISICVVGRAIIYYTLSALFSCEDIGLKLSSLRGIQFLSSLFKKSVLMFAVICKFSQKNYNRYYRIITGSRFSLGFFNSWRPYL